MQITLGQPYSFCQRGSRLYQEDARYPDCDSPQAPKPFFLVCDGVGGSAFGEVASTTVCKAFGQALDLFDWTLPFTLHDLSKTLGKAYKALDRAAGSHNADMATTLALVVFHRGGCLMAHIGDSRVYQIRPSVGILYRSEDHSLVGSMVRQGSISADEVATHPKRSAITRYMEPSRPGRQRFAATVCQTVDVKDGDYFLLCSDGVLDKADEDAIVDLLCGSCNDWQKVEQLAERCATSQDNNTAILIPVAKVCGGCMPDEYACCQDVVTQRIKCSQPLYVQDVSPKDESFTESIYRFIDNILN